MTNPLNKIRVVACATVIAMTAASAPSFEPDQKILPNFHRVNEQLYRGAQPLSGGIKQVALLGIRTIINLRGEDEGTRSEKEEAEAAGLRYVSIPLHGFRRPKDEEVERVLAVINDSQNWPVFVHCHHGEDRTGLIIACYRISHDGWSSEQAKNEARKNGMSRFQFGMKDYIGDYYKRRLQRTRQSFSPNAATVTTRALMPDR